MLAGQHPDRHRRGRPLRRRSSLALVYVFINIRSSRAGGRLRDRAGPQPQAVPTTTRSSRARSSTARSPSGCSASFVVAVGLPLYWLAEPGRQAGARRGLQAQVRRAGARRCSPPPRRAASTAPSATAAGGRGRRGRLHAHRRRTASSSKQVKWKAPALNTVLLRYSREEVRYILTYGRPFSPMPAWGIEGGGPMNDQQIQNLIDYLESIQLTPEEAQKQVTEQARRRCARRRTPDGALKYPTSISDGEAPVQPRLRRRASPAAPTPAAAATRPAGRTTTRRVDGNGALGPSLRGGVEPSPGSPAPIARLQTSRSTSSAPGPSRASSTAATARAPAACRASAQCRPRSTTRSRPARSASKPREPADPDKVGGMLTQEQVEADRRATSGASDDRGPRRPRRHHLGPRLPRHPRRRGRRRSSCAARCTCSSPPTSASRLGFLLALTGLFGWMTIMGLVWWIYGIG